MKPDGFMTADGWVPLSTLCPCPCECYRAGVPDDSGKMGWCDRCRMNIHSGLPVDSIAPDMTGKEG